MLTSMQIERVVDGLRERKFEGHRAFLRDSGAPAAERQLFHGTAAETVVKILKQVAAPRGYSQGRATSLSPCCFEQVAAF
jgi:hypothetical protein